MIITLRFKGLFRGKGALMTLTFGKGTLMSLTFDRMSNFIFYVFFNIIDDALFPTGTGLERMRVVGLDQDC